MRIEEKEDGNIMTNYYKPGIVPILKSRKLR